MNILANLSDSSYLFLFYSLKNSTFAHSFAGIAILAKILLQNYRINPPQ